MRVVFRVDASLQIGSGHVMRCLALADVLTLHGVECHFLCREHPGHLIEHIRGKGHFVHRLTCDPLATAEASGPAHAAWLGGTQEQDASVCREILEMLRPDWMIVDHYALDIFWEEALKSFYRRLMVIDDLADRQHRCDLLLDQNLGRRASDYTRLVPAACSVLVGPEYALLRPEFAELRDYSLKRREKPGLRSLLITMGGVDMVDASGLVLDALRSCDLPHNCQITVVMGATAPWLEQVRIRAAKLPWQTRVVVNAGNMAQLMADADLCIGAAGSTSWERCTLGLPCILLCLADNQKTVIQALASCGAAMVLDMQGLKDDGARLLAEMLTKAGAAAPRMIENAAAITDGSGCARLLGYLLEEQ